MVTTNRLDFILGRQQVSASELEPAEQMALLREVVHLVKPRLQYLSQVKSLGEHVSGNVLPGATPQYEDGLDPTRRALFLVEHLVLLNTGPLVKGEDRLRRHVDKTHVLLMQNDGAFVFLREKSRYTNRQPTFPGDRSWEHASTSITLKRVTDPEMQKVITPRATSTIIGMIEAIITTTLNERTRRIYELKRTHKEVRAIRSRMRLVY